MIAGPGEFHVLEKLKGLIEVPYLSLYLDDIMSLGAVLSGCLIFIGNDNGPKHMAVALGLPTFTIFCNIDNPLYLTYPDNFRHRIIGGYNPPGNVPIIDISNEAVNAVITEMINDMAIDKVKDTAS